MVVNQKKKSISPNYRIIHCTKPKNSQEMIAHIQRIIGDLKVKVKKNVELINKNQDSINLMLKHSKVNEYGGQFEAFNNENKELIEENIYSVMEKQIYYIILLWLEKSSPKNKLVIFNID